jgi:hypothetical protein
VGIRKYGNKFPASEKLEFFWPDEKLPNCSALVDFVLEITQILTGLQQMLHSAFIERWGPKGMFHIADSSNTCPSAYVRQY